MKSYLKLLATGAFLSLASTAAQANGDSYAGSGAPPAFTPASAERCVSGYPNEFACCERLVRKGDDPLEWRYWHRRCPDSDRPKVARFDPPDSPPPPPPPPPENCKPHKPEKPYTHDKPYKDYKKKPDKKYDGNKGKKYKSHKKGKKNSGKKGKSRR